MKGRADAARRQSEQMVILSWMTGARTAEAMGGKLKKPDHYLPRKHSRPQTPDEMLSFLRDLAAQGAPLTFTEIN